MQLLPPFLVMLVLSFSRSAAFSARSCSLGIRRGGSRLFAATEEKETGHQPPPREARPDDPDPKLVEAFRTHQQNAPQLSNAEAIRTLVAQSTGYGTLATNSLQYPGFPTGSIVGFNTDCNGKPFFVFSSMSAHTKDINVDGRVSLTVTSKNFKDAADGRVVLIGTVKELPKEKVPEYREMYLQKHQSAFWVDFGDFTYYTMDNIDNVRFIGGFARAGAITGEEYEKALVDPLASFADPVMNHMNEDHSDSTIAMIKHYVGIDVSDANIVGLDKLGMTVKAKLDSLGGGYSKIRLPFPREISERKAVKEVIVEMTKASAGAGKSN